VLGAVAALNVATLGREDAGGTQPIPPAADVCLWTTAAEPQPLQPRAEQVILSCVACHLPASGR
jgi:hypothetical protein